MVDLFFKSFILFHLLFDLCPSGLDAATCQTFLHMHTTQGLPQGPDRSLLPRKEGWLMFCCWLVNGVDIVSASFTIKMAPFKHISREPVLTRFLFGSKWRDSCVTSSVSVHSWNDLVIQMSESILSLCVKHKSGHCGLENKDNSGLAVSREQNGGD